MAQLQPTPSEGKRKKAQPLIDMTPMVDLGFLLITFFIFTSALAAPHKLNLLLPKDGVETPVKASHAITAKLMGDGNVMVYEGIYEEAVRQNKVVETTLDVQHGLGAFIRQKQQAMGSNRLKLIYIIHPTEKASYSDVVNALDEAAINGVERYTIVDRQEHP